MDSGKIIQLTTRLMELTSDGKIRWNLINKKSIQEDETDSGLMRSPLAVVGETIARPNALILNAMKEERWERFIYSTHVGGKVFRLNGIVFPNQSKQYGSVRLQLWDADETELEYEFPNNVSFVHLFQLVHNRAAVEVDKFIDQFLENRELLETVG